MIQNYLLDIKHNLREKSDQDKLNILHQLHTWSGNEMRILTEKHNTQNIERIMPTKSE
jgi:hypothetical protein